MAATIAAPIEKRLGEIAGVTELTSVSSQGSTQHLRAVRPVARHRRRRARRAGGAERRRRRSAGRPSRRADVPQVQSFRGAGAHPRHDVEEPDGRAPSTTRPTPSSPSASRRCRASPQVEVSGAEQPAIRVRVNPTLLASMGLSMEEVRSAIAAANAVAPVGAVDGDKQAITIDTNTQLRDAKDYGAIVLKTSNGNVVRLSSVASVEHGTRNTRSAAMFDKPAGGAADHQQAARRQRPRHRRPGESADPQPAALDPGGHRHPGADRPHHDDTRQRPRHAVHAAARPSRSS